MEELTMKIAELEKQVKRIKRSKQKKNISEETMVHFKNVLSGIDELNKDVLNYSGTNIFLYSKLNDNSMNNFVQYSKFKFRISFSGTISKEKSNLEILVSGI